MATAAKRFWLAVAALTALGFVLRLWGYRVGLPYVYNVDEGAHFVPRAIGMFDHGYDPGYFINPPALTYVFHVAFWLRWGGDHTRVLYGHDPGAVYAYARVVVVVLSSLSIPALAWAARRLFADDRVALVAAGLFAVAFLPVHYGHFALNDAVAVLPVCLSLAGAAGVYRDGRGRDIALAAAAAGVAAAFKYTAGIAVVPLVLAWWLGPARPSGGAVRAWVVGAAAVAVGFLVLNPYALLSPHAFVHGLRDQSAASNDGGGKLGLQDTFGVLYYVRTTLWGLGVLPMLAAVAGAVALVRTDRRLATLLLAAPVLFLLFMGLQDRFFARWLLPVYPFLVLAAAYAITRVRRRAFVVGAAVLLALQSVVYVVHNDHVLTRPDTRVALHAWMVANIPRRAKIVMEPIAPDAFADPWIKRDVSHYRITPSGRKVHVGTFKIEDYEPSLRPDLIGSYTRGGYCWVVTGSIMSGRPEVTPKVAPYALRYYAALRRDADLVFETSPMKRGADLPDFSFDDAYNWRPLGYARPGPRVMVYRLHGNRCT